MSTLQHGPLHADLYAYTMAQALHYDGLHNTPCTFHSFIRRTPFGGSYLLNAGLADFMKWLEDFKFLDYRMDYLASLKSMKGNRLLNDRFLKDISQDPFNLTIDALPEGSLAFPHVPMLRVKGGFFQGQNIEGMSLNTSGQSLLATEASRCVNAARNPDGTFDPIMDASLRRSIELGGLSAARSAAIGGFTGTSNIAAGLDLNIPVRGTFAHAFVIFHENEAEAFRRWIRNMDDIVILLDTYSTIAGVHKAIAICKEEGKAPDGWRLDSGIISWLSKYVREASDDAGFHNAFIMPSGDMDPFKIADLKAEQALGKAAANRFMVGSDIASPSLQSTLGSVYKLADVDGRHVIKLGEPDKNGVDVKTSIPGPLGTLRFLKHGYMSTNYDSDIIVPLAMQQMLMGTDKANDDPDKVYQLSQELMSVKMADSNNPRAFRVGREFTIPHIRVVENGVILGTHETSVDAIRKRARHNLDMLQESHFDLKEPYAYVAGLEEGLYEERRKMIRNYNVATQTTIEQLDQRRPEAA